MYTCINHCTAVGSTGSLLTDWCVCVQVTQVAERGQCNVVNMIMLM